MVIPLQAMALEQEDWPIILHALPGLIRELSRCRSCVELDLVGSWDDLVSRIVIDLLRREQRGSGYNPDRGALLPYLVIVSEGVAAIILRRRRRLGERIHACPWWASARDEEAYETEAIDLAPDEVRWLEAYVEHGSRDRASSEAGLTQRAGRAVAQQILEHLGSDDAA